MPSQREPLLCRYHYDALDQLISHMQPDTPEWQRFYCKSRLATEIQGALQHSVFQQGERLLAQQKRQNDTLDTALLATDQQRSVLHTLKENNQRHPIAYSPYGNRPAGSGLISLLGFNGELPDPVTGHYLLGNGYRAFNPVLMRFNSPDSWSPFGKGGLNPYAYCIGDPINQNDPSGHFTFAALVRAISPRRRVQGLRTHHYTTLKGEASPVEALRFIDELKTGKNSKEAQKLQQATFREDYKRHITNTGPLNLQSLARHKITSQKLSTKTLPKKLQTYIHEQPHYEKLFEYLRDKRKPDNITLSESNLHFLPTEINNSTDPTYKEIATKYRDKMYSIRSPAEGEHYQRRALAKKYFQDPDFFV